MRWLSSANPARIDPLSAFTYYAYSAFTIRLSRFFHLVTFKIPPLAFSHTTPAIAYTSGMFSLPSAARVATVRPSRVLSSCLGALAAWLSPRPSSDLKVSGIGAIRQAL